jgi:hypothetical protein
MPLTDFRPSGVTSETGWVSLNCKHHPELRWVMKDPRTAHNRISRNPQIMFYGHVDRLHVKVWGFGFDSVNPDRRAEFKQELIDDGWTLECTCPFDDLQILDEETD